MNKMMTKASLLVIAFIVSLPLGLAAQDEGYYAGSYARLTYVNGAVYVERTAGLGYEKGEVNLALVQGDRIGTETGQAEIHFGRRNYLRLDNATKVEFVLLPSAGEERIKLHLTAGSVFLRVSELAVEKGIELHTPDASFYVLEAGLYRFDVQAGGETRAFAREGSLEAAAEDGSVVVRNGETVTAADGRFLNDPEYAYAPADAFDDWNGGREAQFASRSERQYLPSGIDEYEEELDQNGYWVYERPYGNVWVPYAARYDDWRPYYHGRWVWYPVVGWTWVPAEPWGWAVYHYGRWNWRFGLGWYWIPQHHWGPAWVHWWWDGDYIGWCPLTWYNRPAYLFHDRFYDRWNDRYFSAHNRAMTVIRRDHLQDHNVGRRHLASNDLDRIHQVELRDRQPAIRPAVDNARPQAIAARRALADPAGARDRVREAAPSRSLSSSRLRSGAGQGTVRSAEREATARPSIRNDGSSRGSVRSFPSRREADGRSGNGIAESRRGAAAQPDRGGNSADRSNEGRVVRSRDRDAGSSRPAAVREPQRPQSSGNDRSGSVTRREGPVKSDPPARSGSSVKSSAGRSQSRSYAPSPSITRQPARVTAPADRPSSRPAVSGRSSGSSPARSGSTLSRPRSSSSGSSRSSSSPGFSAPRSGGSSSGRTMSAPRTGGSSSRPAVSGRSSGSSSSGRSGSALSRPRGSGSSTSRSSSSRGFSAPRSGGSSSGRTMSAPRSGGSSSRGAVRSGGSASSGRSGSTGRSGSSGSRSSGSSSRSGSVQRKK